MSAATKLAASSGPFLGVWAVDAIDDGDMDAAARLYLELRAQLNRRGITARQVQDTNAALRELSGRFPGVAKRAATAAEHELTGGKDLTLGREGRKARDRVRDEHGTDAKQAASDRRRAAAPPKAPAPRAPAAPRAAAPRRRRSSGGRARRAWQQTGIPASTGSASRTALQLLGGALTLTFLYLLLRNPKAVETAGGLVAGATRVLIAPVNPLSPQRHQQAARTQTPVHQPASRPTVRPRRPPRTAGVGWTP